MLAALLTLSTIAVASAGDGTAHQLPGPTEGCADANIFLEGMFGVLDFIPCPFIPDTVEPPE